MTKLVPVDIEEAKEPWAEYRLSDGTVLKIKLVVVEVHRQEGVYMPDGEPQYNVRMAPVISTNAPAHLKKPAK